MHVTHAQTLLPTQTLLNRESGTTSRERQYTELEELTRLAPDIRRCIPYLLYYGDVTDNMFRLLVQQICPFGVQVIVYPRRASLQHLEERGIMGYFMGPGDGPSMDRVYISGLTGATVRQYRHVVMPLVCLEMHAALMHHSRLAATQLPEQVEAERLEGDQARLQPYERGLFEVADRDMHEVPPYENDAFMQQVLCLAAFDHVQAAPPPQTGAATIDAATVQARDWGQGERPKVSRQHNQPGRALTSLECPRNEWPAGTVRSPPPEPALLFSRDAHRHTPEVAADVVAQTCERLLTLREPGLRPTWGLDAEHPPAADAHEGTEEHIRDAHRDRHTVDCGDTGMSPDLDILQSLAGDASPLETDGSDSDQPDNALSEPAPPPHPAAMGNASPVRGLGGADDSAMAEGVVPAGQSTGLDEGVAPGLGGAVVAPAEGFAKLENEVGQFLHWPATVCVPAAPLHKNPLIRRTLVLANVATCVIGAAATRMWTPTTYVTPRHVACEQGKSTATRADACGLVCWLRLAVRHLMQNKRRGRW